MAGDAVEDLAQLLGRRHRLELAVGQLDRQVELAAVTDVDDGAAGRRGGRRSGPAPTSSRATGSMGRWVADRPDAHRAAVTEVLQALQGQGQVRAPLVAGQGVDLVDDHRAHRSQLARLRSAVTSR